MKEKEAIEKRNRILKEQQDIELIKKKERIIKSNLYREKERLGDGTESGREKNPKILKII